MFLKLIEVSLLILASLAIVTQVLIPWVMGLPLFPLFRAKRLAELQHQLEDVKQAEVEKVLSDEIVKRSENLITPTPKEKE